MVERQEQEPGILPSLDISGNHPQTENRDEAVKKVKLPKPRRYPPVVYVGDIRITPRRQGKSPRE